MRRRGLSLKHLESLKAEANRLDDASKELDFTSGLRGLDKFYRAIVLWHLNDAIPKIEQTLAELKGIREELE